MSIRVRQKRKGKGQPWYIFIYFNNTCRARKIGDKKTAEAVARKLRAKWLAGELKLDDGMANTPRFGQYAQHYLQTYARVATKLNTWRGYEKLLIQHLLPVWANRKLGDIRRADVKKLKGLDLIVPAWTMGTIEREQLAGVPC